MALLSRSIINFVNTRFPAQKLSTRFQLARLVYRTALAEGHNLKDAIDSRTCEAYLTRAQRFALAIRVNAPAKPAAPVHPRATDLTATTSLGHLSQMGIGQISLLSSMANAGPRHRSHPLFSDVNATTARPITAEANAQSRLDALLARSLLESRAEASGLRPQTDLYAMVEAVRAATREVIDASSLFRGERGRPTRTTTIDVTHYTHALAEMRLSLQAGQRTQALLEGFFGSDQWSFS